MKKLLFLLLLLPVFGFSQITGPDSICVGPTYTYNDKTAGTWTILGYQGSISVIVQDSFNVSIYAVASRLDTIIHNYKGGHDILPIVVNKSVSAITASSGTHVCSGTEAILTNVVTGVHSWSSNRYPYDTVNSNDSIYFNAAGTAQITITAVNGCLPDTASIIFYIDTLPAAITFNTDSICIGSVASYSNTTKGGIWYSSNNTISTVNNTTQPGFVTGLSQGIDTIFYSVNNLCGVNTASQPIYVFAPVGAISGPRNVLAPGDYQYTNPTPGGYWYISDSSSYSMNRVTGLLHTTNDFASGYNLSITYLDTNACGISQANPLVITYAAGVDTCHWKGSATPIPCPDYRPWKTYRDDQLDLTNTILSNLYSLEQYGTLATLITMSSTLTSMSNTLTSMSNTNNSILHGNTVKVDTLTAGDSLTIPDNSMVISAYVVSTQAETDLTQITGLTNNEVAILNTGGLHSLVNITNLNGFYGLQPLHAVRAPLVDIVVFSVTLQP